MKAKPFIKWVGSKRALCPTLRALLPEKFGVYFEPFTGSGALFFDLLPEHAVLCDANRHLMAAYRGIRDELYQTIELLVEHAFNHSEAHYYSMRAAMPGPEASWADHAAWFLYINKACFNGLWRVNGKGQNNVAWGKHDAVSWDFDNLRACSRALQKTILYHGDFHDRVSILAGRGDLVYFDPPYVPVSASANFDRYTKDSFGPAGQLRLRDLALELRARGVHVLLSNSDCPAVRDLYRDGFEFFEVTRSGKMNSDGAKRGKVGELIMRAI